MARKTKGKNKTDAPEEQNEAQATETPKVETDPEGFLIWPWKFPDEPLKGTIIRHRKLGPAKDEADLVRQLRILVGNEADQPMTGDALRAATDGCNGGIGLTYQNGIKAGVKAEKVDTPEGLQDVADTLILTPNSRGSSARGRKAAEKAAVAAAKDLASDDDFLAKLTPEQRAKFAALTA